MRALGRLVAAAAGVGAFVVGAAIMVQAQAAADAPLAGTETAIGALLVVAMGAGIFVLGGAALYSAWRAR